MMRRLVVALLLAMILLPTAAAGRTLPTVTVAPCSSPGPHGGVGVYVDGREQACTYGIVGMDYCPSPGPTPGIMIWVGNFWMCIY